MTLPVLTRRLLLSCPLAGVAALWTPAARACEFYLPTLRVTHPYTRATGPEATSAVVMMKFDEVVRTDRLIDVWTPVAEGAELGGEGASPTLDFEIPEGLETWLHERGTYVKLTGLKLPLEVGRAYPLKLRFAEGGDVDAQLSVDYTRFR